MTTTDDKKGREKYQKSVRAAKRELRVLRGEDTGDESAAPRRMTLSHIVEMLLTRSTGERSAVTITRNASGATQIEVNVRTGDDGEVVTVEDAESKAVQVYERLRERYPATNGHDNAEVALTRNAKGETQIAVSAKTSEGGFTSLDEVAAGALSVYDSTRAKYPMADGYTAKPGSVAE